jgi:hypothetical protein
MQPRRWSASMAVAAALVYALLAAAPVTAATIAWSADTPVSPLGRFTCDRSLINSTLAGRTYLHAVYRHQSATTPSVVYRRSTDLGKTWPHSVVLATRNTTCPKVAASGPLVVVAWPEYSATGRVTGLIVRVSSNGGATFGPRRSVVTPRLPGTAISLAVSPSRIFVAYTDGPVAPPRYGRIAMSTNLGVTWSSRRLDSHPAGVAGDYSPLEIAASGTRVFAAWLRDDRTIAGRFSIDTGTSWQPPTVLGTVDQAWPQLTVAARPDRAAVVWGGQLRAADEPSPKLATRIFVGGSWRAAMSLTATPPVAARYGYFSSPSVVLLASTRVGITWSACPEPADAESPGCGDFGTPRDVLWTESLTNGATWIEPSIVALGGRTGGGVFADAQLATAIWPSASFRGLLIARADEEHSRVFFVRGDG